MQTDNIGFPVCQGCMQHLLVNVLPDALQLCFENVFDQRSDVRIQSLFHYSCADLLRAFCHELGLLIYCFPGKKISLISTAIFKKIKVLKVLKKYFVT